MYSYEDKKKAVDLFFQQNESYSTVQRILGYPKSIGFIKNWVKEFKKNKMFSKERAPKYTLDERKHAVTYFLIHGKSIRRTCRELGYPSRTLLREWILEDVPAEKQYCKKKSSLVKYTREQKRNLIIKMCTTASSVQEIAANAGVARESLYKWKNQLLQKGEQHSMVKKLNNLSVDKEELLSEQEKLQQQVIDLQKQVYKLQIEKDVLEKAAEIIKKEQGIILNQLTNKEKAIVIDTLRDKYSLKELLSVFHMAKSSYCYQKSLLKLQDKYRKHRQMIHNSFNDSGKTYGYRRIYLDLRDADMAISEKVIRRIMKEENLKVKYIKRKKYNSYMGEISPAVENIVNRDFSANKPNEKWLTDITEFAIPAGKVYLSPIIDCFDGLPVSWSIGTHPDAELVNSMLENAISILKPSEKPIVHSDRGAHYRWSGWIERIEVAGLLTRSMSRKGYTPDNAACEGFFGRLKNEMFYNRNWLNVSIDKFIDEVNKYIEWYAHKRRKLSLGGLSPISYRKSLGLLAG